MSFMDKMKVAAKAADSYVQTQSEDLQNYRNEYSSLRDEELLRKFQHSSGTKKLALASIIKERERT